MRTLVRTVAEAAGRGLVAGLVGTAAMTLSSTVEARLTGRGASTTPADAAQKVSGLDPGDDEGRQRFSESVHWTYGTVWGVPRALLGAAGVRGLPASGAHLAAVWGSEQLMLPALGVADPVWRYGAQAATTDALHHLVYAVTTGVVSDWLDRD
ncbi:MAG TPA: hypothetical protein VFR99_09740 [Marmoricola sp.]|nr:hypothetical protein [Marmoricola sp.]